MQLCGSLSIFWHCLFWGLEWKLTFSSPVATAEFSKFVGILSAIHSQHFEISQHFSGFVIAQLEFITSTSFVCGDASLGYMTSHSSMSLSRWVITQWWLSGSWRSFLYSSSAYSCHLFLISSASVLYTISVLCCAHLCMEYSLGISNFLDMISSLSHSIVFPLFLASIT